MELRRPAFEQLRLDTINYPRGSRRGSTPQSADTPDAANRALEILRVMLASARKWRDLGKHALDACASIVRNPRRPLARHLDHAELERLDAVLDRRREEHPWPVVANRLLTLTGVRLSETIILKWNEIGDDGASARIKDSKTGPRTIWLGLEAARLHSEFFRTQGERATGVPRESIVKPALHVLAGGP